MHITLQKRDKGQTWASPIQGQGQLDPYSSDLEQKRLMLQRFQEEVSFFYTLYVWCILDDMLMFLCFPFFCWFMYSLFLFLSIFIILIQRSIVSSYPNRLSSYQARIMGDSLFEFYWVNSYWDVMITAWCCIWNETNVPCHKYETVRKLMCLENHDINPLCYSSPWEKHGRIPIKC